MLKSAKFSLALLASTAALSPAIAVQHYTITDLGVVPSASGSVARAISANGQIGGESNFGTDTSNNVPAQFNGGATALPNLAGSDDTYVRGINDNGVAAAVVQTAGGDDRAALLSSGGAVQLGGLSGFAAAGAFDVNTAGVAVGYVLASGAIAAAGPLPLAGNATAQKAVIWTNGVPTQLADPAGAVNSVAYAINDNGTVTGMYRLANGQVRGVIWTNGEPAETALPTDQVSSRTRAISEAGWVAGQTTGALGVIGTVWTPSATFLLPQIVVGAFVQDSARGINSAGTVVGFSNVLDVNGDPVSMNAMLWDYDGASYTAYDLSTLVDNLGTWQLGIGAPQAINDRGDIVGFGGLTVNGQQHAYLLTAVPEPASWALMVAGFGLVGSALRRRQALTA